ncbi:MAG: ral secretion pathway protein [Halanaerobiales bacterium]|nr:ral secretion pathway protein [Halanaerobiales bacterium]
MQARRGIFPALILFLLLISVVSLANAESDDQLINMNFKEADIRDVLRSVAELGNYNLVIDGSVEGMITLHLREVSFNEALDLITQTHNLAYKWDGNTVVVATPERIEDIYAKIITRTVEINYAELVDLKGIITGIHPGLNVQLDQRNHSLILKGKEEEISEAIDLIKKIDIPRKEVVRAVKIEFADPGNLEKHIKGIFPELRLELDKINRQLIIHGLKEDVENALLLIERLDIAPEEEVIKTIKLNSGEPDNIKEQIKGIYPDLKVQVDQLNDQLIISGKKAEVEKAVELVRKLDIPREEITDVVQLKFGQLEEIKNRIIEIAPDLKIHPVEERQQLVITGKEDEVKLAVSLARKLDQLDKEVTEFVRVDYLDLEETESILSGFHPEVKLQFNQKKKELIINGKEDDVREAIALIRRLDTPRRQVIIEARIEEISRTELKKLGIYPDKLSEINFVKDDGKIDSLSISWPDAIKALEESGSANTLANPRLMTLNGEKAKLLIGDRIPVVVEEVEEGMVTKTIEYIEAGITLEFKPWITGDNQIVLEVSPKVSSIGESIGSSLPPINTREVETKIRLKDGETFAIGGLIQDDIIESVSKVPVLSEIPILGELFKHRSRNNIKTELIIFITPHIVKEKRVEDKSIENDNIDNIEENENVNDPVEETSVERKQVEEPKAAEEPEREKVQSGKLVGLTVGEIEGILNKERRKREGQKADDLPAFLNVVYIVNEKESIVDIALKYGLPVDDICFVNGLEKKEVEPGSRITIPVPKSHLYRRHEGETLRDISQKFGVEEERLKEINNIDDERKVPEDMIIIVPKVIGD